MPEIFRYVALLGGAKNIDQFKRQMQPTGRAAGQQPNPFVAGACC
jgi:hypothetical protein